MNYALKSALSNFRRKNSEIFIGGRPVSTIADEFGTPLYIYDCSIIDRRHEHLRRVMPPELQIYYSVKANPNVHLLNRLGYCYNGADISSIGELEIALDAGINSANISFSGPGKSRGELEASIKYGIGHISIESEKEVSIIQSVCSDFNRSVNLLVRINPSFDLPGSGMKMRGIQKPFGVEDNKVPVIISKIRSSSYTHFSGIHIFSGSQNLQAEKLIENFKNILEYALHISETFNVSLDIINMGGGFGIPYFAHEKELDLEKIGTGLRSLLNSHIKLLPKTTFRIELGRYIVGEAGLYVSRVLYRKETDNMVFLVLDGGMHHHLAASGNLGQSLIRRPFPIITINKLNNPVERVTIVGPLCTPIDTFGAVNIPKSDEGDLIGIFNSGAYGYSASPMNFLSRPKPKEIIID